jgi:hypothetical protein
VRRREADLWESYAMDWLEFISSVVRSVVWPAVIVSMSLLFKPSIISALGQIRHLKAPGIEADFGDYLADVEKQTEAVLDAAGVPNDDIVTDPSQRVTNDPSGTIMRAWQDVSAQVASVSFAVDSPKASSRNPMDQVRRLSAAGIIDPKVPETILELRQLRDLVAHGKHNPTEGEALAYADTADDLSAYLRFVLTQGHIHGHQAG